MMGLWQLTIAMMIFAHISASLPSLERQQRQIELKLIHQEGMRREYEKLARLLQTLMTYKRSIPNTSEASDASGFINNNTDDLWHSEDKVIKLKTCLQFVQNLDESFSGQEEKDAAQMISHSVCQLIAEMNEAAAEENQKSKAGRILA